MFMFLLSLSNEEPFIETFKRERAFNQFPDKARGCSRAWTGVAHLPADCHLEPLCQSSSFYKMFSDFGLVNDCSSPRPWFIQVFRCAGPLSAGFAHFCPCSSTCASRDWTIRGVCACLGSMCGFELESPTPRTPQFHGCFLKHGQHVFIAPRHRLFDQPGEAGFGIC